MRGTSFQGELSIFPINLEKKNHYYSGDATHGKHDRRDVEKDSAGVITDHTQPPITPSNQSFVREYKFPLLQELQQNGQLQELTITEHRRSAEEVSLSQNGYDLKDNSTPPKNAETNVPCGQARDVNDTLNHGHLILTEEDDPSLSNGSGTPSPSPSLSSSGPKVPKRRTRKSLSPNDPAEALTEMSVRGLDLFRYATINAGMYQCLECRKDGMDKTFKNKYSFQRHAFLYHEGKQRKVFPCPVCSKEFSRPDKMKNHLRVMHEPYEEGRMMLYRRHPGESPTQLHPQQQQCYSNNNTHRQGDNVNEAMQQQLQEEQRRRQQEHDVMKIRSMVNAINLRQLQHFQQQQQARELHEQQQQLQKKQLEDSPIPAKLIPLNGVGSQ